MSRSFSDSGELKTPRQQKTSSKKKPKLKNGNTHQNNVLGKAWEISHSEKFVYTILGENIELTPTLRHGKAYFLCWNWESWGNSRPPNQKASIPRCSSGEEGWFWRTHYDQGICGISDGYYKHITDDPRFPEWEWQIEKCWELYSGGTRFYGEANSWYTSSLVVWE